MKIYIASPNSTNPGSLHSSLRSAGHTVYVTASPSSIDDLNPAVPVPRFDWYSARPPGGRSLSSREIRDALTDKKAQESFRRDVEAIQWSDIVIAIWPPTASALLAAGSASAAGKPVFACMQDIGANDAHDWLLLFNRIFVTESELLGYIDDAVDWIVPNVPNEISAKLKKRLMLDGGT